MRKGRFPSTGLYEQSFGLIPLDSYSFSSFRVSSKKQKQTRAGQSRPEQTGADRSRPEQTGQGYKVSKLGFGKTRFVWVRSPSNLGSPATAHLEPICLLPTLPPKTCGQASALPELTTLQEPPKPRSARLLPDLRVDLKDRPTCTLDRFSATCCRGLPHPRRRAEKDRCKEECYSGR